MAEWNEAMVWAAVKPLQAGDGNVTAGIQLWNGGGIWWTIMRLALVLPLGGRGGQGQAHNRLCAAPAASASIFFDAAHIHHVAAADAVAAAVALGAAVLSRLM
jgi:predicted secreted protein